MLFEILHADKDSMLPLLAHHRYTRFVDTAIDRCQARMLLDAQNIETVATGLLHYMLTRLLIPSQRKISMHDTSIDVVIPGLREMQSDAHNGLVIIICCDAHIARQRLAQTRIIQPIKDNIWLLTQDTDVSHARTYYIHQRKPDLGEMMHDIAGFVKSHKQHRLGITGSL